MRTKYASTRFSIVKRSKGQSAVDAASYISRSVLVSEYDGKTYRPKYHEDLVHCEINLPEYAPEEWLDRAVLWNSVELNEKQKNAQLCRTLKAALPNDWSYELAEETVRDYVQRNFVSKGMCADWAIHDSVIKMASITCISILCSPCARWKKTGSGEPSRERNISLIKTAIKSAISPDGDLRAGR